MKYEGGTGFAKCETDADWRSARYDGVAKKVDIVFIKIAVLKEYCKLCIRR